MWTRCISHPLPYSAIRKVKVENVLRDHLCTCFPWETQGQCAVQAKHRTFYTSHVKSVCVCVFVLMEPTDTNRQTDVTVDCQRRRDGQCKKLTEEHKGLERHKDSCGGDGEDSTQPLCTLLSPAQLPAMRNSSTAALSRKMQSTVSGALLHHLCLCVCVSIGSNHFHQLSCRAVGNHC